MKNEQLSQLIPLDLLACSAFGQSQAPFPHADCCIESAMTIPITSQKSKLSSEDAVFVALVPGGGSDIYLTPELIARAATFATTEVTLRDSNSELMNLCLAVGPSTSRTIKHYYLKTIRDISREHWRYSSPMAKSCWRENIGRRRRKQHSFLSKPVL